MVDSGQPEFAPRKQGPELDATAHVCKPRTCTRQEMEAGESRGNPTAGMGVGKGRILAGWLAGYDPVCDLSTQEAEAGEMPPTFRSAWDT